MQYQFFPRRASRAALSLGAALLALWPLAAQAAPDDALALPGHIPAAVARAQAVSRLNASTPVSLALTLPLRNQAELSDLLRRLYDPSDPLYGHYLTPDEFTARFGPTQEDYDRVIAYAQAVGLTVTGVHSSRTIVDVSAPAATVENAFGVHFINYRSQEDGRVFYAPDADPLIPASLAGVVSGVVGLNNAAQWHPHNRVLMPRDPSVAPALQPYVLPRETGSGPGGGLTPSDIKTAYNLNSVPETGAGQTIGLFELDGYTPSDIAAYEAAYGLPALVPQNILVDGFSGNAGGGAGEVTLDIELQLALAPNVTKLLVYEAANSDQADQQVIDLYDKIATDNMAKQISTSWGSPEKDVDAPTRNAENSAFQQMSMQGQSIFAAAGDSGAYDNGTSLSVDDPASQPFMVGVGGTSLTTNGPGGAYTSETTWADPYDTRNSPFGAGGGGGISSVWAIPSFQQGVLSPASFGSTTHRNVPDVSLDADPNTGYAIYFNGGWTIYGGTSCAAPLWAAFTALVDQRRTDNGRTFLGFADPAIYTFATGGRGSRDFHDIADGSDNLYYPAVTGYDDATGWGTFNGANLIADLSGPVPAKKIPAAPTLKATDGNAQVILTWNATQFATSYNVYRGTASGKETLYQSNVAETGYTDNGVTNGKTYYYEVTAVNSLGESPKSNEVVTYPQAPRQLIGNPGFENGASKPSPWVASAGVIDDNSYAEPAFDGQWKAWLDGYGVVHTDTLSQQVTIPSAIQSATLTFYLDVDTSETTTTTAYDTLVFQIRNTAGKALGTVATYSNLTNTQGSYILETVDLSAYKGQTVQLYIVGKEDNSLQTSFLLDDFALTTQ